MLNFSVRTKTYIYILPVFHSSTLTRHIHLEAILQRVLQLLFNSVYDEFENHTFKITTYSRGHWVNTSIVLFVGWFCNLLRGEIVGSNSTSRFDCQRYQYFLWCLLLHHVVHVNVHFQFYLSIIWSSKIWFRPVDLNWLLTRMASCIKSFWQRLVMSSLIGWAHGQNDPCVSFHLKCKWLNI